jgi:hypothetical protein
VLMGPPFQEQKYCFQVPVIVPDTGSFSCPFTCSRPTIEAYCHKKIRARWSLCDTKSCCTNPGPWIACPLLVVLVIESSAHLSPFLQMSMMSISKFGVQYLGALILLSKIQTSVESELPIFLLQHRDDLCSYAIFLYLFSYTDFGSLLWLWITTRMMPSSITYSNKYVHVFDTFFYRQVYLLPTDSR